MAEYTSTNNPGVAVFENREGDARYHIRREYWLDRPHGLSAMLRVRDEEAWLSASIASAIDWHDEIVIILQGEQTDASPEIARDWQARRPDKIRVYEYPWIVRQEDDYRRAHSGNISSLHERSFYKNWCLSKTTFSHAHKWDGDMVACDGLGREVRRLIDEQGANAVRYAGLNLAGRDLRHVSRKEVAVAETRVYRVTRGVFFRPGNRCQQLVCEHKPVALNGYRYLHLKWCKTVESATKAWPMNWGHMSAYQRYRSYAMIGRRFSGPYPAALRERLEKAA
jgi:glycosyltransferase involved in cell wall biosynthesis